MLENYYVEKITQTEAIEYIRRNHYTKGSHNAPNPNYGIFDKGKLIGVLMFAQPCSENVRGSIWGKEHKEKVIELHRLHIQDTTPKNTESWFIGECLRRLAVDKPEIRCVISFADSTEGHTGVIYRATNFYYVGKTASTTFYKDSTGRLRHPRQNSVNISREEARRRGWSVERRGAKNRYIYIFGKSKKEKKELIRTCRYDLLNSTWCDDCGREMPKELNQRLCPKCRQSRLDTTEYKDVV